MCSNNRRRLAEEQRRHDTEERDDLCASGMERGVTEAYARIDELLARLASNEPV